MMSRLHARPPTPRAIAVAVTLASLLLAAPLAYAENREPPRADPSRSPSATSSLAGNQAGQGRPRPGRTTAIPEASESGAVDEPEDGTQAPTSPSPSGRPSSGSASPSPSRSASGSAEPETGRKKDPKTESERESDRRDEGDGDDDVDLSDDSEASADAPFSPRTPPQDASAQEQNSQAVSQPVARAVPALTLGIGMALMGLGIGFLGVRLRRH
ncbi:hypothetical protein ACFT9I_08385 [Streptomyces sp. NPDC057137]|uniref:hypothetical protein n=1 Tax=Streptomyces sp. NPDC057137 TaxID=3346030 RepID=UPI00363ABFFD